MGRTLKVRLAATCGAHPEAINTGDMHDELKCGLTGNIGGGILQGVDLPDTLHSLLLNKRLKGFIDIGAAYCRTVAQTKRLWEGKPAHACATVLMYSQVHQVAPSYESLLANVPTQQATIPAETNSVMKRREAMSS